MSAPCHGEEYFGVKRTLFFISYQVIKNHFLKNNLGQELWQSLDG
jgi:hypothetical protein